MPYKPRIEKDELKILRSLNVRMELSPSEKKQLYRLEKGFEGEVMFDLITEKLPGDRLILNDLLLEVNNTKFQIDTLIIVNELLYLFEVKNFEGDYVYENGEFHSPSQNEISNPLDQLKRCGSFFRQLLHQLGYNIPVEGQVIFINLEFALYQAPIHQPYVLPTQINRYMHKKFPAPSKLNGRHEKLAAQLVALHQVESPYERVPKYEYGGLRKGILCVKGHSFMAGSGDRELVCQLCKTYESFESAVVRSVDELKLLFPGMRITTNLVYEWCGGILSKKTIKRILDKYYKIRGYNRWSYFE